MKAIFKIEVPDNWYEGGCERCPFEKVCDLLPGDIHCPLEAIYKE